MAIKPGRNKPLVTKTSKVLPRNKVFVVVGKGIVLKGKVKHGSA